MTASELAILALGLILGAASGAALVVTLGSRPTRRDVRVTVTRDAVPRRSETLSQDAFVGAPGGPAPGGPGDRRGSDRDVTREAAPATAEAPAWRPVMALAGEAAAAPNPAAAAQLNRTLVPSADPVAIPIEPEGDRELEGLRSRPTHGTQMDRMLRGDHRAMMEVVDGIAGEDGRRRRSWELLLGGLVEALADAAVRESVIDFPMGTAFWDAFTIEQCRRIVAALHSMGYRYDGVSGWIENRVPTYRDMTRALADVGVEPRRLRAWPNQGEIASLFIGARPAPEELIAAAGPDYTAGDMQMLLGEQAAGLADLWATWEAVRPGLLGKSVLAATRPGAAPQS